MTQKRAVTVAVTGLAILFFGMCQLNERLHRIETKAIAINKTRPLEPVTLSEGTAPTTCPVDTFQLWRAAAPSSTNVVVWFMDDMGRKFWYDYVAGEWRKFSLI